MKKTNSTVIAESDDHEILNQSGGRSSSQHDPDFRATIDDVNEFEEGSQIGRMVVTSTENLIPCC